MTKTGMAWVLVALIGVSGIGLAFQGWRARGPDVDVVSSMVRTVALVERGHIPRRGNLTDHQAFRPPGTSWLLVPGVVLFSDPRRIELTGSGLLYLLTLPGVFLLGRFFSARVALFGTLLYAVSWIPIFLAAVLQPKAHPFFCVWMTYCAVRWVRDRDARWLGAAGVLWASGLYVHIEMLPLALMLPVLWWVYRPPVRALPVLGAAAIALIMWAPFLAFQWERGFVDLRSQLFLQHIDSRGPITVQFCGEDPQPSPAFMPSTITDAGAWRARPAAFAELLLMNFESRILAGAFVMLALLIAALATAAARDGRQGFIRLSERTWWIIGLAVTVSVLGVEFTQRWLSVPDSSFEQTLFKIRWFHVYVLLAAGLLMSADTGMARWLRELRRHWPSDAAPGAIAIAMVVPSVILMLFSEPGVQRTLGLWPTQVVLIAAFVVAGIAHQSISSRRSALLMVLVALIFATNLEVLHRVRNWQVDGWAGPEPAHIDAAEFRNARCEDER